MPLYFDPAGQRVPPGRVRKTWHTDFDGGAASLDDWLTFGTSGDDTGSALTDSTLSPGGVVLTTGTTSGNTATLYGPSIDLTATDGPRALRITLACHPDSNLTAKETEIGFLSATAGGFAHHVVTTGYWDLVGRNGATDTDQQVNHVWRAIADKRHIFSLLLTTRDGGLYSGEGEQVFGRHEFGADLALGSVQPVVRIRTTTSAARALDVHQITVERWWA